MLLKCCIICYRKLDEALSEGRCNKSREGNSSMRFNCEETVNTVHKFFQFLERYLAGTELQNANECDKNRKHSKGVFEALVDGRMLGSCENCLKLLTEFCGVYHKMKEMELMLNWKLWTIKNIMGSARKVGVRIADFRKSVHNLVATEDVGNADEISNAILDFKRETARKCKRKLVEFPKLKLHRCPGPGPAKPNISKIQSHESEVREQQRFLSNEGKENITGKTRVHVDASMTRIPTDKNQNGTSLNDISVQPNSQLKLAAAITGFTNVLAMVSSAEENTEAIVSLKIETSQEEVLTNPTEKSGSAVSISTSDINSTLVSSLVPIVSEGEQSDDDMFLAAEPQEDRNSYALQTPESPKIASNNDRFTHVNTNNTSPQTCKQQEDELHLQENCDEFSLNESIQIEKNESEEIAADAEHHNRITVIDTFPHKLESFTGINEQFDASDDYSPCNSISSTTPQETNFGEDNHNKLVPNALAKEASTNGGSTGIFSRSPPFSGNIPIKAAISTESLHSSPKRKEGNLKLTSSSHSDINEGNFTQEDLQSHADLETVNLECKSDPPECAKSTSPIPTVICLRGIHRCSKCSKSFSTKMALAEHEEVHDEDFGSDSESSSFCDSLSETESDEDIQENTRKSKTNSNKKCRKDSYPCKIETCNEVFPTFKDFKAHLKLHGVFNCNVCKVTFSYAPDLAVHEMIEHPIIPKDPGEKFPENLNYCPRPRCAFVVEGRDTYIQHHLWAHQQLVSYKLGTILADICYVCKLSIQAADKSRLKKLVDSHQQSHHHPQLSAYEDSPETLKCGFNHCTAHFLNADQLTIHKCKIHGLKENFENYPNAFHRDREVGCDEYPEIADVNVHMKLPGDFSCKACKATFGYAEDLAVHELAEHPIIPGKDREKPPNSPKNIYCCPRPHCAFVLEGKNAYVQHHLWAHQQLISYDFRDISKITCNICKLIVQPVVKSQRTLMESHHRDQHLSELSTSEDAQLSFKCEINYCTAHFLTSDQLTIHKFKIHGIGENVGNFPPSPILKDKAENVCNSSPWYSKIIPNSKFHIPAERKLFSCYFCEVKCSYAPEMAMHETMEHSSISAESRALSPNIYHCSRPNCVFTVEGKVAFIRHYLTQHLNIKYFELENLARNACSICGEVLGGEVGKLACTQLTRHYNLLHNMKTPDAEVFWCKGKDCSAYFMTPAQLNKHQFKYHAISEKNYRCRICNKLFWDQATVKEHRKTVHRETINLAFPCTENGCKKSFENQKDLQGHINMSHKKDLFKIFNCPICEKPCPGKGSLATHMKIHNAKDSRRFVCEQCGKKFVTKKHLERHYLTHSGPSSWEFACSVCQKKCLTKQKLEEHVRTHTKEKPFVCDICGEKYAHRHNLRIHVNNKHGDVAKDLPGPFDKTNLTSRKGIKRKRPIEPESAADTD